MSERNDISIVSIPRITVGSGVATFAQLTLTYRISPKGEETLIDEQREILWGETKQSLYDLLIEAEDSKVAEIVSISKQRQDLDAITLQAL